MTKLSLLRRAPLVVALAARVGQRMALTCAVSGLGDQSSRSRREAKPAKPPHLQAGVAPPLRAGVALTVAVRGMVQYGDGGCSRGMVQ